MKSPVLSLLVAIFVIIPMPSVFAQGTVFPYQGRLNDNGQPANGTYDLTFTFNGSANQLWRRGVAKTFR